MILNNILISGPNAKCGWSVPKGKGIHLKWSMLDSIPNINEWCRFRSWLSEAWSMEEILRTTQALPWWVYPSTLPCTWQKACQTQGEPPWMTRTLEENQSVLSVSSSWGTLPWHQITEVKPGKAQEKPCQAMPLSGLGTVYWLIQAQAWFSAFLVRSWPFFFVEQSVLVWFPLFDKRLQPKVMWGRRVNCICQLPGHTSWLRELGQRLKAGSWRQELEKARRTTALWLADDLLALLSYVTQDHPPRAVISPSGLDSLHQSTMEEVLYTLAYVAIWWGNILSWGSLFPHDPNFVSNCKTTKTTTK